MPRIDDLGLRADTAAGWAAAEVGGPATTAGENVWIDNDLVKCDGVTKVNDLPRAGSGTYAPAYKRGLPDLRAALPELIATAPTITYSGQNTATSISTPAVHLITGSSFLRGGAQAFAGNGGTDQASNPYVWGSAQTGNELPTWFAAFLTDAPSFEIVYQGSANPAYRLLIDGYAVSQNAVTAGGAATGAQHRALIAFGSRKWRSIQIESEAMAISAVVVGAADTITPRPARPILAVLGDSYIQNGGVNGFAQTAARILGCDWLANGSGGTGYNQSQSGANGKQVYLDRLAGVLAKAPAYLLTCGGINDGTSTLQADVTAYLALAKASLTSPRIFVTGPWSPPSQSGGTITTKRDLIQAAATAAGVQFIDNVAAGWQTGTGSVASPAGDGNSDIYIPGSGETTHPVNPTGYTYLGMRAGLAVAALIGS